MSPELELAQQKLRLRQVVRARRSGLENRDALSARVIAALVASPEFIAARSVLFYVDVRGEVATRTAITTALASGRRTVVPYCVDDDLHLFELHDLAELAPGRFGVPEPLAELRAAPERRIAAADIDLVIAPGVAFDRRGGRLGSGQGYYDRLLARLRPAAVRMALAFECQLVDDVPTNEHDQYLDLIVTEAASYRGSRRGERGVT